MSTHDQGLLLDDVYSSSDDSTLLEKELDTSISTSSTRLTRLKRTFLRRIDQNAFLETFVHYNLLLLRFLTPSFLHHLLNRRTHPSTDEEAPTPSPPNTIKCLDGLRGIACLIVFNFHFLYPYTYTVIHGYGAEVANLEDRAKFLHYHQLPFISLLYRGRAMVHVFFAISGYVLSRKFLKLVGAGSHAQAYKALSSAVFRRGFRLFLPVTVGNLLVVIALRLGLYNGTAAVLRGEVGLPGDTGPRNWVSAMPEEHPRILGSAYAQLVDCYHQWARWINPWTWEIVYGDYDPHTWTIPLEFRSSMVLFLVLVGTAGLRGRWRLAVIVGLCGYCLRMVRWEVAIFLGGVVVAQIDLMWGTFEVVPDRGLLVRTGQWVLFVAGLYLLASPDIWAEVTPGYRFLSSITPEGYAWGWLYLFWYPFGAVIVVHCVTNLVSLRRVFERPVCQYFGRISFAFYLVHGPVLHALGFALMPRIWRVTGYGDGYGGNVGFVTGLALGWGVLLCFSVWLGDIFWRVVNVPCTKLTRQIECWLS
ncbi:hypothetical protein PMZ80_000709 [Knufia obscura]|uniref:Acyltransferase 3 domain-containing protein n=1 Tax=Knufia obscura TaxID=1635080 RepID=A0ABR0S191_9EURO|nr:hypothetical protein PMZ80_000709 [Knufia obscura]